jgi:hypothetical protein
MPGGAEKVDAVEACPDSALEVESFDLVGQRDAVRGLGCGGSHPNCIKIRSN